MHKQRKLILISSLVGALATFLPWYSASAGGYGYSFSRSENGFHTGLGVLYFLLMLAGGAVACIGDRAITLQKNMRLAVVGSGAVAIIIIILAYANISSQVGSGYGLVDFGPGFGYILSLLAAAALIAVPLVIKNPDENFNNDIANFKSGIKSFQQNFPAANNVKQPSKIDELEKLITWKNEGKITEEEYNSMKSKIL